MKSQMQMMTNIDLEQHRRADALRERHEAEIAAMIERHARERRALADGADPTDLTDPKNNPFIPQPLRPSERSDNPLIPQCEGR